MSFKDRLNRKMEQHRKSSQPWTDPSRVSFESDVRLHKMPGAVTPRLLGVVPILGITCLPSGEDGSYQRWDERGGSMMGEPATMPITGFLVEVCPVDILKCSECPQKQDRV